MPSRRDRIGLRKLVLAIWLGALLQAFAQPVRAEVSVSGQADALTVETREASVEEVLAALRASFNLHYRSAGALNRVMTGTYTGSLQRVIARLLEGQNYVIHSSAGGRELIVFGPGAADGRVSTSGRLAVADATQQKLPIPNAKSATQGPARGQASPGLATKDKLKPPLVGRETNSDKTAQTPVALPDVTLGAVMTPVLVTTAVAHVPAISTANTPSMPPPAPNTGFGFGPPTISHPAGPIPLPVPGASVSPQMRVQ